MSQTTPSKNDRVQRHLMRQRGAGVRSLASSFGFSFAVAALQPVVPAPEPETAPSPKRRKTIHESNDDVAQRENPEDLKDLNTVVVTAEADHDAHKLENVDQGDEDHRGDREKKDEAEKEPSGQVVEPPKETSCGENTVPLKEDGEIESEPPPIPPRKQRGRPRKIAQKETCPEDVSKKDVPQATKRRGRPKKLPLNDDAVKIQRVEKLPMSDPSLDSTVKCHVDEKTEVQHLHEEVQTSVVSRQSRRRRAVEDVKCESAEQQSLVVGSQQEMGEQQQCETQIPKARRGRPRKIVREKREEILEHPQFSTGSEQKSAGEQEQSVPCVQEPGKQPNSSNTLPKSETLERRRGRPKRTVTGKTEKPPTAEQIPNIQETTETLGRAKRKINAQPVPIEATETLHGEPPQKRKRGRPRKAAAETSGNVCKPVQSCSVEEEVAMASSTAKPVQNTSIDDQAEGVKPSAQNFRAESGERSQGERRTSISVEQVKSSNRNVSAEPPALLEEVASSTVTTLPHRESQHSSAIPTTEEIESSSGAVQSEMPAAPLHLEDDLEMPHDRNEEVKLADNASVNDGHDPPKHVATKRGRKPKTAQAEPVAYARNTRAKRDKNPILQEVDRNPSPLPHDSFREQVSRTRKRKPLVETDANISLSPRKVETKALLKSEHKAASVSHVRDLLPSSISNKRVGHVKSQTPSPKAFPVKGDEKEVKKPPNGNHDDGYDNAIIPERNASEGEKTAVHTKQSQPERTHRRKPTRLFATTSSQTLKTTKPSMLARPDIQRAGSGLGRSSKRNMLGLPDMELDDLFSNVACFASSKTNM